MPYVPNKTALQPLTHPVIEMQKPKRKIAVAKTIFLARKEGQRGKMQTGTWMHPCVPMTWETRDRRTGLDQDWISNVHSLSAVNPLKIAPATTTNAARTVLFLGSWFSVLGR